jgi:hypothetical protein
MICLIDHNSILPTRPIAALMVWQSRAIQVGKLCVIGNKRCTKRSEDAAKNTRKYAKVRENARFYAILLIPGGLYSRFLSL